MRCVVTILGGGFWLLGAFTPALAQSPDQLTESCVWIRAENETAGTGFILDAKNKLIVTCRHIVADRARVDLFFPWFRGGTLVTERQLYLGNRASLRERGLLLTGKVLKIADESDLALIQLDSLPSGLRAIKFAAELPGRGESLRMIGHRLDLDTLWNLTTGVVRATGPLHDGYFWRGKKLAENATVVIGQLPTEEGDSGGPVVNDKGELVGMASALRRQCPLAAVVISAPEIRKFAGLAELPAQEITKVARSPDADVVESLVRATVWIRPAATDTHRAGVLIDKDLVLTSNNGLIRGDRSGVAFPVQEKQHWSGERSLYQDAVGLALRDCWRSGVVLANDPAHDLALIQLDSTPEFMRPLTLAKRLPTPGECVHAMNHPGGLEFAWVYSRGTIRQRGSIQLMAGDNGATVHVIICQLPTQSSSPGGPLLNDQGELVGLLASRESAQLVGYSVSTDEIARFLDVARTDQLPRSWVGIEARFDWIQRRLAQAIAQGLVREAEQARVAGNLSQARQESDKALSLDSACGLARLCRSKLLTGEAALAELDRAIETGPFLRAVLRERAELAIRSRAWRKARGDLERLVEVDPLDAEARLRLVGVLLELNEDATAAQAVADTLRADPKLLRALAAELLAQTDALAKKFPNAPGVPAKWLLQASLAAERGTSDFRIKTQLIDLRKQTRAAKDDAEKLDILLRSWRKLLEKVPTQP